MSNALTPVITNQGREALMNGFSTTSNYRFSHVALGNAHGAGYDIDPSITSLENELQRVAIESVVVQDSNRLHITAVAGLPQDGEEENAYDIHEIGFFLQPITSGGMESGEPLLFAVYATKPGDDQKALMTKEPGTELLLAFDLLLPDMSEEDYKFDGNSYLHIRSANKEMAGLVRLAEESDVVSGEADNLAVTPLGVKSAITNAFADRYADPQATMKGKSSEQVVTPRGLKLTLNSRLASSDEALAGEANDKYVSPLTLSSVLDEQAVNPGDMQAALINQLADSDEALAGDIDDKAVTPAGLKATLKAFNRSSTKKPGEDSETVQDLAINGSVNFKASGVQMINLRKADYGIGIQKGTQYFRSEKNFAWYARGVHTDEELTPGKRGVVQMVLSEGNLGIGTKEPKSTLTIANKEGKEEDPDADMHITANSILFGGHNSGKYAHSAHISAGLHVSNSLNIVGMSSDKSSNSRKIDMWAEGGMTIRGQVNITDGLKPDYDSNWHHITDTKGNKEYTFKHNLKTYPAIVQLFAKSDGKNNGKSLKDKKDIRIISFLGDCFHNSDNERAGFSCRRLTTTIIKLLRPGHHIWHGRESNEYFNSGYIRILMWKGFAG